MHTDRTDEEARGAAVADGRADGRTLQIGGPEALTGTALAREVGAGLGREMACAPIPPAAFAQGMTAAMGAPAGDRLAAIYAWLVKHPDVMRADPAEAESFDVPPGTAQDFAAPVLEQGCCRRGVFREYVQTRR